MIHPTAIITGLVTVADSAIVEPYAIIRGPVTIEDEAYIGPFTLVGGAANYRGKYPQPLSAEHDPAGVIVQRGATIREHSQVHHGIETATIIGENALIMASTHIGHDCSIGAEATLSVGVTLGGFVTVGSSANLGLEVTVHPWILIGECSMVGMNSSVIRDVPPYAKVAGSPARLLGSNRHMNATLPEWYDRASVSSAAWSRYEHSHDRRNDLRRKHGKPAMSLASS